MIQQRRRDLAQRLIKGEVLRARQIADDYQVTMRTVERDLNVLKAAGLIEDRPGSKTYKAKEKFVRRDQ